MERFLVSASTGAMGSVLNKLGTILSDEYKLLKGVRDDIKFLKDELEAMHAFLLVMANVENPDQQAKLRADAVRELSYEIEDNIDKFMVHMGREPGTNSDGFGNPFSKSMKKIADIKTRHKIAKDVKDIMSQVKEISKRYARYKIDESSKPRDAKFDPRIMAVYKNVAELVGIDGPRDELVKWLSNKVGESIQTSHLKVVSIVGYGGLGKTTLAKQIYDKLGSNFECQAFVSISRSPDMRTILSSLLSEISNGREHARESAQQIIDQIREFLTQKRYFIIIDDVWDVQTWQALDCALIRNGCGSVIMSTTRIYDVAKSCCSSHGDLVYKMQPLTDGDSKRLFFKRIFGCEENCPPNLKEASECIIKRCGGLPLAINAMSSLLAIGKPKEEWDKVRRSIGFAQGKNSEIDAMSYILSLSYFDLPLHLRSCLLYLTMYREDSLINRKHLIHKWISEGFIHGEDEDLAELGESYFCELVNRSLIEPVDMIYDGKALYCRVHDTILDFLIYKSAEENFCILLSNHSKPGRRVIRRLSVGLMEYDAQGGFEQLDLSHARSLTYFGDKAEQLPSFMKSNAIRILDLQLIHNLENRHLKDIGRLLQLRYLNISHTNITELPRQIGDLEYLETLDLLWTKLDELPKSITRLKRLARLFVDKDTKLPDGVGNMKNLQELWTINPLKQSLEFVEELVKLTNLGNLGITWDSTNGDDSAISKEQKLVASLCNLERCKLHTLHIEFHSTETNAAFTEHPSLSALNSIREITVSRGQFREIIKWTVPLINLVKLNTHGVDIEKRDLEKVGSIPTLLYLDLENEKSCVKSTINGVGFQQLHTLRLNFAVRWLVFEAGAMPNLKRLCIVIDLDKMEFSGGFDDFGLHHLSRLDTVSVLFLSVDLKSMASIQESAMADFKSMVDAHPNRPTLHFGRV